MLIIEGTHQIITLLFSVFSAVSVFYSCRIVEPNTLGYKKLVSNIDGYCGTDFMNFFLKIKLNSHSVFDTYSIVKTCRFKKFDILNVITRDGHQNLNLL